MKKKKERERKLLKKTLRVARKKERENDKCVTPEIVVRRSISCASVHFFFFRIPTVFKLTEVRAKMNLSVGATILCVLVVALLSETAYIRPPDWHLRYGFKENQVRFLKKTAAFETCLLLGKVALFKMLWGNLRNYCDTPVSLLVTKLIGFSIVDRSFILFILISLNIFYYFFY